MSAVALPPQASPAEHFAPMLARDLDDVLRIEDCVYPFPWTRGNFWMH
jgi:hypothetical protein